MVVVDDRLLLDVLLGQAAKALRQARDAQAICTTGCWYYRLCRAARTGASSGALSGPLAAAPPERRADATAALLQLPSDIALLSLRELAPRMADLSQRHDLNLMSLEALATAVVLGADLRCANTAPAPRLEAAARSEGIGYRELVPSRSS